MIDSLKSLPNGGELCAVGTDGAVVDGGWDRQRDDALHVRDPVHFDGLVVVAGVIPAVYD